MTTLKPRIAKLASALLLAFIPSLLHAQQKIFFANDYGAKGDGIHFDGVAIQEAIHVAAKNGNTLTFKPGTYLIGSLFLESGMTFDVPEGVALIGSEKPT